ncbi:RING finger protein-like protein [Zopfia rhizophila CBS 207.26]|uniref:RBR-type E3 ubiquitin transferase n=1 Tax=Zopfia rhizophila CBS 207.26 TaxID=1314779 RepID=A0A6A6E047_9PEZI|nr:RING finger protein-like protein [Zopfia rhizophila CBS 207.26]
MAELALEDEREEELTSLQAIYPELVVDSSSPFTASLDIRVTPVEPLRLHFPHPPDIQALSHLPPLHLKITLPEGYPSEKPPFLRLTTTPPWIPSSILENLEKECSLQWEEYGHCQVLFSYISYLQEAAECGFGLAHMCSEPFPVATRWKTTLVEYNTQMQREKFNMETFDCGICLEPKKGSACYRMRRCGHVFCIACLQDFYNNCITEGDMNGVKCLSPDCGKEKASLSSVRRTKDRLVSPKELLRIPLELPMVQRYVELKRKKKLESDKSTVWCPRKWCQGAARSKKYPKVTDITRIEESDTEPEDENRGEQILEKSTTPQGSTDLDRVAICEDCGYAFCRVCFAGWHGEFVRCWPRDASEISEEEQASMNYILAHTSPCPTCSVPCQKTHGCNHMSCFQCKTHFCYLCSSWLDPGNPYQHFNDPKKSCFERLWELEEGDEGSGQVQFDGIRGAEAAAQRAAEAAMALQVQEIEAAGQATQEH